MIVLTHKISLGKPQKKFFTYFYLGIGLFSIILIASVFALRPGAIVIDDGGGGGYYPDPSPPPTLPPDTEEPISFEPTSPAIPDAPELLIILPYNDNDGLINLAWSFEFDALEYHVFRSKDGSVYEEITSLPNSIYTYTDNVSLSGTYKYMVKSEGISGISDPSNEQQVVVSLPVPVSETPEETPQDTDLLTGNTHINFIIGLGIVIGGLLLTFVYFYLVIKKISKQKRVKK